MLTDKCDGLSALSWTVASSLLTPCPDSMSGVMEIRSGMGSYLKTILVFIGEIVPGLGQG